MRPFAHAEARHLPWLVDARCSRLGSSADDVFVGFEDPVRRVVA